MESTPPSNSEALSIVREFVALERERIASRERIELARMASEERHIFGERDAEDEAMLDRSIDALIAALKDLLSALAAVASPRASSAATEASRKAQN